MGPSVGTYLYFFLLSYCNIVFSSDYISWFGGIFFFFINMDLSVGIDCEWKERRFSLLHIHTYLIIVLSVDCFLDKIVYILSTHLILIYTLNAFNFDIYSFKFSN
jgi:hypothetical protein